jgi:hypothetical protein
VDAFLSTGYSFHLEVYKGKDGQFKRQYSLIRIQNFEVNAEMFDPQRHVVFMDNFCTSYDLADLRTLEFRATGTFREVLLKKCQLEEMKERDKYEQVS